MPRTPADIGRDIAAAEQQIRDLKAELADVPPRALVVSGSGWGFEGHEVEFDATSSAAPRVCVTRGSTVAGTQIGVAGAAALRDWLNYYFPKEA